MRQSILAVGLLSVLSCGPAPEPAPKAAARPPVPGELLGRVEIAADVPATSCLVLLDGTPLGARCDGSGTFHIRDVPPGRWDLRILTSTDPKSAPSRRIAAGSNSGLLSDLGAVRLAPPGNIGGRVLNGDPAALGTWFVAIPDFGLATIVNANGGAARSRPPPLPSSAEPTSPSRPQRWSVAPTWRWLAGT